MISLSTAPMHPLHYSRMALLGPLLIYRVDSVNIHTNNKNNNKLSWVIDPSIQSNMPSTTPNNNKKYCQCCKRTFSSQRYFLQHLRYPANERCKKKWENVPVSPTVTPQKRGNEDTQEFRSSPLYRQTQLGTQAVTHLLGLSGSISGFASDWVNCDENSDSDDGGLGNLGGFDDDGDDTDEDLPDITPITSIREDFLKYTQEAYKNRCDLTDEQSAGIELLAILTEARAPSHLYDKVFHWHVKNLQAVEFLNQQSLVKTLTKRYNMESTRPKTTEMITLPHSKARIQLVMHEFKHQVASILTDPRLIDDDYLFFGNDPFKPPPEDFQFVGDINTGRAYRETYKRLIIEPSRQILLPIIFYMDGAVTGQFDHLPIEALKFTIGILNRKARDSQWAWRVLGYITQFLAEETRGQEQLRESSHLDAQTFLVENKCCESSDDDNESINTESGEDNPDNGNIAPCAAQDLHAMLDRFLESYREIEKRGFEWDLRYKGKTHRVEFIPFVMFVKGDSQEHDKHCGKYTSRGAGVGHLCRYCCCPNEFTDEPYKRYKLKNPQMVQDLVNKGDLDGLKAISQQSIQNAWYKCQFGLHNKCGIHSATPLETLHWLQIGKYGYLRNMFFTQSGKKSQLSDKLNTLAKMMGFFYKRQSDRDLPRTDFSKGIRKGKLMAHEMSGVMLVLCTVLRCTEGRKLILQEARGKQKGFLGNDALIADWIMMLETMLQWECWLKMDELSVNEVKRSEVKVRELMALEKQIGKREEGMGFKTFNFHGCLHMSDDILNFGVPANVNTSCNEMHHKPDKTAAMRTQKRLEYFDIQCAQQIHKMTVVAFGLHEIDCGKRVWTYLYNESSEGVARNSIKNTSEIDDVSEDESTLEESDAITQDETLETQVAGSGDIENGGAKCSFFYSYEEHKWTYKVHSRMKDKHKFKLETDLCKFLEDLGNLLGNQVQSLPLFTQHKRFDQIFRASPSFLGKPWRDWVMIDWGGGIVLPGQIWIFIDLSGIPNGLLEEPGVYAVVESSELSTDETELQRSWLFQPYFKETEAVNEHGVRNRKFYLVDVNSFYAPTCMIPDFGAEDPTAYLRLRPRNEWSSQFSEWLGTPYERQFPGSYK